MSLHETVEPRNLIAYGSLMFDEVMDALTGRRFASESVVLENYRCYLVQGAKYPGIIRESGVEVRALIYFDLDRQSFELLDSFEDKLYCRAALEISTLSRGPVSARIFSVDPEDRTALSDEIWCAEKFKQHLPKYLSMCRSFRQKYLSRI